MGRVVGNNPSIINGLIQIGGGTPNLLTIDQQINFTVASLGLVTADLNADSPLVIRVVAIALGATLRINGVSAVSGTIVPLDAVLEYIPPIGFTGLLSNAFSVTVDDVISVSAPRAIALKVDAADIPNLCVLATCQVTRPQI